MNTGLKFVQILTNRNLNFRPGFKVKKSKFAAQQKNLFQ